MDEEFTNDADGETFFDLDQATFGGGGDDEELNDEETFGDIGPLSESFVCCDLDFRHSFFESLDTISKRSKMKDEMRLILLLSSSFSTTKKVMTGNSITISSRASWRRSER